LKQLKCTDDTNYLVKVSTKLADRIENYDEDEENDDVVEPLIPIKPLVWTMMNEDDDDDSDDDDHQNQMLMTTTMMKIQTNLIILMTKMTMRINFI
jgi:hypothetical protein